MKPLSLNAAIDANEHINTGKDSVLFQMKSES